MLKDLIKKCRSYRSYDESVTLTREQLLDFVDHSRYAPSSVNRQTLRYRLVYTPEEVAVMRPLTGWAKGLPGMQIPPLGHHAAAFIVICEDTQSPQKPGSYLKDTGISAMTILLAAVEAGFGGCMIGSFNPQKMAEAMNIPEQYEPVLVVALGKPDEEIELVPVGEDGVTKYYRTPDGKHHVPKRALEDIIL